MRNRLIHGYISVNLTTVLDTVRITLPAFRATVASLRAAHGGTSDS